LKSLKQENEDLTVVSLEEMDLGKKCIAQDSRFVQGTGYKTDKFSGMIFQTDPQSELISKIRLTKEFKGKLPDGNYIDLSNSSLKDLLKTYPKFKGKWGSRGCSDYWNFSNDTLSFYVRIDSTKKPQYPIDEAYYLEKPVEAVDLIMSCYKPSDDQLPFELVDPNDPIFFIDSILVNKAVLQNYEPNEIATVTVFRDSGAVKIMGPSAKNGLIYIETKEFCKMKYWRYFRSKSAEYAGLLPSFKSDSNVQYILNTRLLKKDFEGDLASIDDKIFKSIKILNKQELKEKYHIKDKQYGVVIISDVPANLHNGKSKF
jgi:hypothetical protein